MAQYVCPSCGAAFNGKKCKNCCYEALAESQLPRVHRETRRTEASPWEKSQPAREKKTRRAPNRWMILLFILVFGLPILRFLLVLLWNLALMIGIHFGMPGYLS